jgi:hypothetical protein
LQLRRKRGSAVEIFLPIVFFAIMMYLKTTVVMETGGPVYNANDYGAADMPVPQATDIYYAPADDTFGVCDEAHRL